MTGITKALYQMIFAGAIISQHKNTFKICGNLYLSLNGQTMTVGKVNYNYYYNENGILGISPIKEFLQSEYKPSVI